MSHAYDKLDRELTAAYTKERDLVSAVASSEAIVKLSEEPTTAVDGAVVAALKAELAAARETVHALSAQMDDLLNDEDGHSDERKLRLLGSAVLFISNAGEHNYVDFLSLLDATSQLRGGAEQTELESYTVLTQDDLPTMNKFLTDLSNKNRATQPGLAEFDADAWFLRARKVEAAREEALKAASSAYDAFFMLNEKHNIMQTIAGITSPLDMSGSIFYVEENAVAEAKNIYATSRETVRARNEEREAVIIAMIHAYTEPAQ